MSVCGGCGAPLPPRMLTCPSCGQRHPTGPLRYLAGAILVLFALAVLWALSQVARSPGG